MAIETSNKIENRLKNYLTPKIGTKLRYLFFGGKGGVGKTSTSAAVAVKLADNGSNTLIISTDPAHSLGDALSQDLTGGIPIKVENVERLYAMEVDPKKSMQEFEDALKVFDLNNLASELGIPLDIISNLGLEDFGQILQNPPPGIDELVALSNVLRLAKSSNFDFDNIVIDTAPTGHTLRLLKLPDFLDSFLEKIIDLRKKLDGTLGFVAGIFGKKDIITEKADFAVEKLLQYKQEIVELRELFLDSDVTEFCIVTIPTKMAFLESQRLLTSLQTQGVMVNSIVLNQVMDKDSTEEYIGRIQRGQDPCLKRLESLGKGQISLTKVPYFDMEVTGVYPLRYMGGVAFGGENGSNWDKLIQGDEQKFVIVGGKGGVGKTTSSASLALKFADEGFNTVIMSTDPAHSLGDCLQVELGGVNKGKLVDVPGNMPSGGKLCAIEVDTEGALEEFKQVIGEFLKKSKLKADGVSNSFIDQLDLEDFAGILDNAPPGTDELVALSKVLNFVRGKKGEGPMFDRVVIDTAPTGHTLRMLTYPDFIDDFFEKIIKVRSRLKNSGVLFGLLGMNGSASDDDGDKDKLRDFQFKMMELQELFKDHEACEFVVVTIPTVMAVAETERLVQQLKEQEVAVKHILVNKMMDQKSGKGYVERLVKSQTEVKEQLDAVAEGSGLNIVKVPTFDAEVRGVHGLRAMAAILFK